MLHFEAPVHTNIHLVPHNLFSLSLSLATQATMPQPVPTILADVSDTTRTNFVGFASFTILVWDHVITFSDEVEYIWKGKKGPIIYLFLLNRYFTPLGFIVNLYAYLSPSWTVERCRHFIRYEGCTVAIAVEVVGIMMLLRINALYPTRKWISTMLAILLVVETGINIWLISRGEPVLHNTASGVHACSMIFDPAMCDTFFYLDTALTLQYSICSSSAASASAWYPLMYDSIVFGLTVNRTLPSIRKKEAGFVVKKLLEDGLLYYSVIFSVTFVLTLMIVGAPPGIKNICAQMEQLLTVAMMSRITLSLRKAGRKVDPPILFDARNPDFLGDAYQPSVGQFTADEGTLTMPLNALKQPERLAVHRRSPIQFTVPPSPQPSQMSDPFSVLPVAHQLITLPMASSDLSDFSLSTLSLHSNGSQSEDWDRSLSMDGSTPPSPSSQSRPLATTTPRNSVVFPANGAGAEETPGRKSSGANLAPGKRSLSELLRLHAEKGTDCTFSPEEAARVADVLRDWINAGSSPYEGEDDFFFQGRTSQDDIAITSKPAPQEGRPRGQSDSSSNHSRPPSVTGLVQS
ncbi:hypothetical protein GGX14DRAFT_699113 [Mycena pura]|uniref:DUF6533 domain-containing protein n=1 Tax=Mycena pura TaxID=153505 RepID=A0AAD6V5A4_9AGAR|nr:hypothetical protein GGX14DRAFT_699113 [Mycena pura]